MTAPRVVDGVVLDRDGPAVPQERVFVASAPLPVPDIAALADAGGRFTITLPAARTYEIVSTANECASATATVDVDGPQERRLELRMDLEEVR